MRERIRNRVAIVIAGLCLALAVPALFAPTPDFTGITLRLDGSVLVVATVDPAAHVGPDIHPGMIVADINYGPVTDIPEKNMDQYLRGDFVELGVPDPAGGWAQWTFFPTVGSPAWFVFLIGVCLLFGIVLWVRRGQAGETLRPLALPLAVATAAPLILVPTSATFGWATGIVAVALAPAALLLLADGFVERVAQQTRRRIAAAVALAAAVGLVALDIALLAREASNLSAPEVYVIVLGLPLVLAATITLVPAAALLTSARQASATAAAPNGARRSDRLPILLAALTPVVVATTYGYSQLGFGLSIPLIWLLIVVVVLQTNARVETLRIQRDTVVAATEVERARLAADLHDDALQEMTILVRRLDSAGDDEGRGARALDRRPPARGLRRTPPADPR